MPTPSNSDAIPARAAWRPEVFGQAVLRRDSPFRYTCHACKRCCQNYRIQVNPYEVLRLARQLELSTTKFIERYLVDGPYLTHQPDGRCVFLGEQGCAVHPDRPLVCRLYPLGRHLDAAGEEYFSHIRPHPKTDGVYGLDGTVEDYLTAQGTAPFIVAAARYKAIFNRLYDMLHDAPELAEQQTENLLDPDYFIHLSRPDAAASSLSDPELAMDLHLAAIEAFLTTLEQEES
jgi:hypothetical protein